MNQFTTKIVTYDGETFVRLLFPHASEDASYASNVLIEFVLSLTGDDRIAPFGMEGDSNYIDIPTAEFDETLARLAA